MVCTRSLYGPIDVELYILSWAAGLLSETFHLTSETKDGNEQTRSNDRRLGFSLVVNGQDISYLMRVL